MLMHRFILLITLGVISINQVKSQTKQSENLKDVRKIEVVGYAMTSLEPNVVYVSFTTKEYIQNGKVITIQEQEKKLKEAVKKISYSENNLKVTNVLGFKTFSLNSDEETYLKTRAYLLKLKGVKCIDKFLEQVDMKYLNDFNIEAFDHDGINQEVRKLQVDAFNRGRDKAQALLAIYNQDCGRVLNVQEVHRYITYPKTSHQKANIHHINSLTEGSRYEQIPTLDLLDIKVEYQVKLTFEIVDKIK